MSETVDPQIEKFKSKERQDSSLVPKVFMSRPDVAELAERLRMMVVGGQKAYTAIQALTLAQAALAHGLSPFNGEIYLMVDNDGNSRGLVIGVKGIRKHARRQARRMGTFYDIKFEMVYDEGELSDQAPVEWYSESSVVVKATLSIAAHVDKWLEQMAKIHALTNMTAKEALELIGPKPQIVTYGVYDAKNEGHQFKGKTKMSPASYAKKRAESAALKEAFDLPFGLEYDPSVDEVFDAEVNDYGPDELLEGAMSMDMDEEQEETMAVHTKVAQREEAEHTMPKTKEGKVDQLGFPEDRFAPDTTTHRKSKTTKTSDG